MNNNHTHYFIKFLKTIFAGMLCTWCVVGMPGGGSVLRADAQSPAVSPSEPTKLWAVGDDLGVYLVLARVQQQQQGFQLFYQSKLENQFRSGPWFSGRPTQLTAYRHRCLVFLDSGHCRSYDLSAAPLTERRLPDSLRALFACAQGEKLYVLAVADQPTLLETATIPAALTIASPAPSEELPPAAAAATNVAAPSDETVPSITPPAAISLNSGEQAVLVRDLAQPWRCLCVEPLPIGHWQQPALLVWEDQVHLFGIDIAVGDPLRGGTVQHARLDNGRILILPTVPVPDVLSCTALLVNRQPTLVLYAFDDQNSSNNNTDNEFSPDSPPGRYLLAKYNGSEWQVSGPLPRTSAEPLVVSPDTIRFATLGQTIAAFHWLSDQKVLFGMYSLAGQATLPFDQPIAAVSVGLSTFWQWVMNRNLLTVFTVIFFALVFWRRQEAFIRPVPLPEFIRLAPLWRRALAFALDFIPMILIAFALVSKWYPQQARTLTTDNTLLTRAFQGNYNIELLIFAMTYLFTAIVLLVVYTFTWELFCATTPGKMIMHLMVISADGTPLTFRAVLLRNLFRALECYQDMVLMVLVVMLLTKRRQRLGDLVARTVVVLNTPALQHHLHHRPSPASVDDQPAADHQVGPSDNDDTQ